MRNASGRNWRLAARLSSGLALPLVLVLARFACAASDPAPVVEKAPVATIIAITTTENGQNLELPEKMPAEGAPAASTVPVPSLSLADCIQLALENQPALAAERASLASAETGRQAVENIRIPSFIVRELPIRRQQAALGVAAAEARLQQAEKDAIYAVTRNYFSVLYARAQQRVAAKVVTELSDALENAKRLLGKEGAPRDLTQNAVDKNQAFLRLAETRQVDAQEGAQRALAALKEAMGVGPDYRFRIPEAEIPEPVFHLNRADIVALALARRGELTQAASLAEITCLEIQAQGTSCRMKKETFAAEADLHARPIPTGVSDAEYRPGAVGPEMPTTLAGSRSARMQHARDLSARAAAVVDKTRNLIALEAEAAYLKWEEATRKLPKARDAARVSAKLSSDTLKDFKGGQAVPYRDVLEAAVLAAQAGAAYNEARYQHILALAALERVTGGGFSAGLTGR